ncbi:group II intron reverse transcriptase/maturase [Moorena sp. SIO3I6]|uniref:group II intron reverse transcriptase/maturase n=1 Tax=Moorena sp. SIO3I6 TaxID=2607831 RepID=UPI0025FCC2FF|nr:group II intron reverse transcriptase/maturase [Moorena sp. SIO3I6]
MSNTHEPVMVESNNWNSLNWKTIERAVFKLQKRIYKASQNGDKAKVRKLQKLLAKSKSAKRLAIRKVTQDNRGKRTAGIDGKKSLDPSQRLALARYLELDGKANPVRRIMIPKPGKKEKRPLGIPNMEDRAKQALAKIALEPEWEAKFETNSYGFRPGRSTKDAIAAIYSDINKQDYYVLDADLEKCFDRIDHQKLLDKVDTYPQMRRQLKAWLKAGAVGKDGFINTPAGTPQGGVISPLLANIALHGMTQLMKEEFPLRYITKALGKKYNLPSGRTLRTPIVHRYADDFIILHQSKEVVLEAKEAIQEWLKEIGLNLKESKTSIAHTLGKEGTLTGFDYLGFNIRQYEVNEVNSRKDRTGKKLGYKTLIKPSKESINRHMDDLKITIRKHRNSDQATLIGDLNAKITGWANQYNSVVSSRIFGQIDYKLFHKLERWAKYRSPNIGAKEAMSNYWWIDKGEGWTFKTPDGTATLVKHKDTKIKRVVRLIGHKSIYDGDWLYWAERLAKYHGVKPTVNKLLKKQKGKCGLCNQRFKADDIFEVDHIIPQRAGGSNKLDNKQLVHAHCHHTKTREQRTIYPHKGEQ